MKYLEKARDMAQQRGDARTLNEADICNITRYLCVYDSKPSQPQNIEGQRQETNIDSSGIPSLIGEQTVHETTISSLSSPSK